MVRSLAAAATLLATAACATSAYAHVRNEQGMWLFTGSTYRTITDTPSRTNRADPISVIWRGPSGATVTIQRAKEHTEQHWRDRRIPDHEPPYPAGAFMRNRTLRLCTEPQFVFYRDTSNNRDRGLWSQSGAYMSTAGACTNQYHIRMWSSFFHGVQFDEPEHKTEWVLAPIHHDRVVPKPTFPFVRHKIDLPWDQARHVYWKVMSAVHCVEPDWAVHPESAREQYGDILEPYSGVISRISFRHKSDGCSGA